MILNIGGYYLPPSIGILEVIICFVFLILFPIGIYKLSSRFIKEEENTRIAQAFPIYQVPNILMQEKSTKMEVATLRLSSNKVKSIWSSILIWVLIGLLFCIPFSELVQSFRLYGY